MVYRLFNESTEDEIRDGFVAGCFPNQERFDSLRSDAAEDESIRAGLERIERIQEQHDTVGAMPTTYGEALYALVRERRPDVVVETGVANGRSTLYLLAALAANDHGRLISVDYPFRVDEDLEEFRAETYEEFGGAAIPADRDPGWIVPEMLRDNWDLRTGKSQKRLPDAVADAVNDADEIDIFVHDAEHSVPAILFELELVWPRLVDDGVAFVDDVGWNDAFETFCDVRGVEPRYLSERVGYVRRAGAA